jgi:HAE1 family hydrophobic/amphiphilic exporter-1
MTALYEAQQAVGPTLITRKHKKRLVEISMNLLPGHTTGEIMGKISEIQKEFKNIPESVTFAFGGNAPYAAGYDHGICRCNSDGDYSDVHYCLLRCGISFAQPFIILTKQFLMGAIWRGAFPCFYKTKPGP